MLVTIIKSTGEKYWYCNRIGESFHVLTSVGGRHRIDARHYPDQRFLHGFFIDAEDCLPHKEDKITEAAKQEDLYDYSCVYCDWIFKAPVNIDLKCPYCKKDIRTNPFNHDDGVNTLGTTIEI